MTFITWSIIDERREQTYSCLHGQAGRAAGTCEFVKETYWSSQLPLDKHNERWGAGVETQKNVRGEIGGWGRVPFNEPYAPSLSTIYDGA